MNKIEILEELVIDWKASYEKARLNGYYRGEMQAKGAVKALNDAIVRIKGPSNKVVEDGQANNSEIKPIEFPKITTSG